jgi:hypothetical protein
MGSQNGELPIPGIAITDPGSVEVIRVWIANQGLHCSLRIGAWEHNPAVDERKAWGIALARQGKDKNETVALIRASLLAELDRPTSSTAGDFVDEPSRN